MYPTLPSHPTYDLAKTFLKLNPGCIWFHLKRPNSVSVADNKQLRKRILNWNKHLKRLFPDLKIPDIAKSNIVLETSYGSKYCKIDPWPIVGKSDAFDSANAEYKNESNSNSNEGIWLRLAVGYTSEYQTTIDQLNLFFNYCVTV